MPCTAFLRQYSRHRRCFLFLRILRCFTSPRSRSRAGSPRVYPWQEVSLGNLRIKGSMRLPGAYRCLARPSSVPEPSHPPDGVAALSVQIAYAVTAYEQRTALLLGPYQPMPGTGWREHDGPDGISCRTPERTAFEPMASCLQSRRSSADLPAHDCTSTNMTFGRLKVA